MRYFLLAMLFGQMQLASQSVCEKRDFHKQKDYFFSHYSLCEVCGRVEEYIDNKCRTCGTPIRIK